MHGGNFVAPARGQPALARYWACRCSATRVAANPSFRAIASIEPGIPDSGVRRCAATGRRVAR